MRAAVAIRGGSLAPVRCGLLAREHEALAESEEGTRLRQDFIFKAARGPRDAFVGRRFVYQD